MIITRWFSIEILWKLQFSFYLLMFNNRILKKKFIDEQYTRDRKRHLTGIIYDEYIGRQSARTSSVQ